jgi:hypothetical protein
MVKIEVIKTPYRKQGYSLKHNQPNGFKGIIGRIWSWYKYKSDAIIAAQRLELCWNK